MNISQIQYVLAVAKYHSFSGAAEHIYMTQPALSLQISSLEKELGFPLFHRTYCGVLPTKEGEAFILHAKPLMQTWNGFCHGVKKLKFQCVEPVRIELGARVYSNALFDPIVNFFDKHPDMQATFITGLNGVFLDEMLEGRIDATLDRLPPKNLIHHVNRFSVKKLASEPQCILLSPEDPMSKRDKISFKELQGRPIVTGPEGSLEEQTILQYCKENEIEINKLYRCDDVFSLMHFIQEGKGVAIGPLSFRNYYHVAAVPLLPKQDISLDFICLRQNENNSNLTLLRNYLTELCQLPQE